MQRIGHETYDLYLYLCKYVYIIFSLSSLLEISLLRNQCLFLLPSKPLERIGLCALVFSNISQTIKPGINPRTLKVSSSQKRRLQDRIGC